MNSLLPIKINTHIVIKDLDSGEILREGHNAIHRENMSIAIANGLCRNNSSSFISEMHFGRGASIVSEVGSITYRKPSVTGMKADLYNTVYFRVVDDEDLNNPDFEFNSTKQSHISGTDFAETVVTTTLDYTDPAVTDSVFNIVDNTQQSLDASTSVSGEFVFDEIGLKTRGSTGLNTGFLLTHFIFHPVEKQASQRIQIVYTLRVQAG